MAEQRPLLLVEDNEDHARIATAVLSQGNHPAKLIWLHDGEEARSYLENDRDNPLLPCLILLDLNLPGISGKELLRWLRGSRRFDATPVVMLTTSGAREDIAACYALGANSYVVKPVCFEEFRRVLRTIQTYWLEINQS